MPDLVAILRSVPASKVRDHRIPGRPGPYAPVGIMCHHTAVAGPGLASCKRGRPDLPGPLCQININRQGVVNVVTDGRANHAGSGSSVVLRDVKANIAPIADARKRRLTDDTDGNRWFIGVEVDNDGVGEPYSPEVQAALINVCVALCQHFGWSAERVIHHREWTSRKIDMSWRGALRPRIRARLKAAA